MLDIRKIIARVANNYIFASLEYTSQAFGAGLQARMQERVERELKQAKTKETKQYWQEQAQRVEEVFTPNAIAKNFSSAVNRFSNHSKREELYEFVYDKLINPASNEDLSLSDQRKTTGGKNIADPMEFEKTDAGIFKFIQGEVFRSAVNFIRSSKGKATQEDFYMQNPNDQENTKKEEKDIEKEKAVVPGNDDKEAIYDLFKDIWNSEIQPKLRVNENKFIKDMITIFEMNYPASHLSGYYEKYSYDIAKIKEISRMMRGIYNLTVSGQIRRLAEIRKAITVLKTRPYFQRDMAKINGIIVDIVKQIRKSGKVNVSSLKKMEKIIDEIDIATYAEKRENAMNEAWKSAMKEVYDIYYRVATGEITYAKIKGEIMKRVANNIQYATAIQNAFGEVVARFLAESLKKNDSDSFEKRREVFNLLVEKLSEKKVQKIGSNLSSEYITPEQMVLSLRAKTLTADINVDDLDNRIDHLMNDSTDEVAPIGLYNNTIEYGPRCDTVNRFGKIAMNLLM